MKSLPHNRADIERLLSGRSHKEAVNAPGREALPVDKRLGTESESGSSARLGWGSRSDIGLVRDHNEDSFLVRPPMFAVCDGMGGHAAGEVASAIAVETLDKNAPQGADDVLLGAAVEAANTAIIEGAATGRGMPGMGCTASAIYIENNKIAIAHAGDSRIYLLHRGTLVRLTRDHSYVEELVDAGEITADEARVHPSRSIITRALGSDPNMYADHFTLDVTNGDRLILCSDGLSSMVEDSEIEAIAVSSVSPQQAADNLVSAALTEGGHDNVTVIVVDVLDDGSVDAHIKRRRRWALATVVTLVSLVLLTALVSVLFVNSSWYLGNNNGTVGIYHGVQGSFLGIPTSELREETSVQLSDLPISTQDKINRGLRVDGKDAAFAAVESYRQQIDLEKSTAVINADRSTAGTDTSAENPATPESDNDIVVAKAPVDKAPSNLKVHQKKSGE